MNVLQLISSSGFYGAEAMVLHLSRTLRQKGHTVRLGVFVNRRNPNDELARRARELDFEVVTLPCGSRLNVSTVNRIRACVEQCGTEVIHSHGYKSNLYALAANLFSRRVLVSTCHNWTGQTVALRAYGKFDRFNLRFFDRIMCVSEEVRSRLLQSGVLNRKLDVILNGIPVSDFANTNSERKLDEPLIGMVGRLVEAKGFQLVLQRVPAILKQFPKARFILIGEGPQREEWARLVEKIGVEPSVSFAGAQKDMPRLYKSLTMFVLPSFNEGMPMSILEAMAAGVPVIATRVGSIPRVVHHEQTGLLVDKGDADGVQNAIERLIANPNFRIEMGNRGRTFVQENASVEQMADRYIAHYAELLSAARCVKAALTR